MKPLLLQNLVEMTAHRDHVRVEVSVLSTLQQLPTVVSVQALEIFLLNGVRHVRPRTWMEQGQWLSNEQEPWHDPQRQPLTDWPALANCVQAHAGHAQSRLARGRHVLWLPVWTHDQVSTCLEVTQSRPFTATRLEVLTSIFNVYQNYQSLLDYSERDALTGLLNRKTFDEQLSRHALAPSVAVRGSGGNPVYADAIAAEPDCADLQAATQGDASASAEPGAASGIPVNVQGDGPVQQWVAVIDIDHFKQVNDRFGHLYGDEVLILVANLLRTSFRAYDRIFRFGGEEFVVLLRSATQAKAHKVFERFRETLQNHAFPQIGQVTVSIGFASTTASAPIEIIGQADQALYFAKEHGRNQVCFYDDLLASGDLQARTSNEDIELF